MKKYLIPTVVVLLVLVVAWTAFGQAEERPRQRESVRQRFQNMSEEEREKFRDQMRERFANMSEEERAQMRERGGFRGGGFMGSQGQEEAIKTIEEQLAKLKAAQITRPEGGFQDLSDEERTQFREKMTKAFQDRQKALQTIIAQVARMQGRRQSAATEGGQLLIINTGDLKPIQEAAKKEKATETTKLLERLIARGSSRGFGGRPGSGQRPQGRGPRRPRPEREQGGGRQQRNR